MLKTVQLLRSLLLILITAVAQCINSCDCRFFPRAALSAEVLFPAQAACFLAGTPNSTAQAHPRCALFFAVVVAILSLARGIDDCQTRDPHWLASPGI